jgi:hypothetical protein
VGLVPAARRGLIYVSRDQGALDCAIAHKLVATDVMGVIVDLIAIGAITEDDASIALSVWDDKTQQQGRPRDWEGFAATLARRRVIQYPYM